MTSMKQVEFFFDYGSPFSYLASEQLPALAQRCRAEVIYRPVLLGAILKATGNASPMTVPAKGKYMALELRRFAARYQIAFKPNPHPFLGNTLKLMRGAIAALKLEIFERWHPAIYRAIWAQGVDLGDDKSFASLIETAGIPPAQLLTAIERQDVKDELRANTDRAVGLGIFGAPSFVIGDELFWGNDRLNLVAEALNVSRE